MSEPRCTGCGKTASQVGGYSRDNPVWNDGTFTNNAFVCTECYCELIPLGRAIGTPQQIQKWARELLMNCDPGRRRRREEKIHL